MTATVDEDIASELTSVLSQAAGVPAPAPEVVAPAPPRKPDPAEVAERPKPKPRAKPKGDDTPRVAPAAETAPLPEGKYAEGLMASGEMAWLALSLNKGIAIGKRKTPEGIRPLLALPDTRPYAAMFRQHLPALAKTWGDAAKQNATVRKYVSKIAGDGDGSWVLGVAFSSAMFAMGCATIARAENAELRAQLAAANDQAVGEYMQQMAAALGLGADQEGQAA